jgi:hypothetical protein
MSLATLIPALAVVFVTGLAIYIVLVGWLGSR